MKTTYATSLFAASASAQQLASVLASPGVTGLNAVLAKYPAIVKTLAGAKDITILAPADGAKGLAALGSAALKGQPPTAPGQIEAALTYHVLKGAIPAASIPAKAFVTTLLAPGNFSAVSPGQNLEVEKTAAGVVFTSGGGAKSKVTKADIKFDGGYIHLIDAVLQTPGGVARTAQAGGLTTLVRLLRQEDLAATVEGLKDITVFAPTNEAFTKAKSTLDSLRSPQLKGALTYHVAKGVGFSTGLKDGQTIPTVNGKPLKVKIAGGKVYINNAQVIKTDILTKNGVVHVIDGVLVPPA